MEQDSTQAVSADTTAQENAVKRLRRGDVRDDGKIFWGCGPSYPNGEYWATPEEFAAKKAKEKEKRAALSEKKASLPTKLRRGDTRNDGKIFWSYDPKCFDGEYWMTPEQFAAEKALRARKRAALNTRRASSPTKLRCGDVREDGMVFWQYGPSYPNGERWVTPEQFTAEKAKRNAQIRERRATDPLFALKDRLRSRVYSAFKSKGLKKNSKTEAMLGCTYAEFRAHIERLFLPGMTWETFLSDGHIDHIVPLDATDIEAEVYALNHYTNLRPMWGPDNISKNAKLPEEHELPENLHPKVREIWLTAATTSVKGYPA